MFSHLLRFSVSKTFHCAYFSSHGTFFGAVLLYYRGARVNHYRDFPPLMQLNQYLAKEELILDFSCKLFCVKMTVMNT